MAGIDWPPASASIWETDKHATRSTAVASGEVPILDAASLSMVADTFRPFIQHTLSHDPLAESALKSAFQCLDFWANQMQSMSTKKQVMNDGKLTRLRTPSKDMLEAIQISCSLRGGVHW